MDIVGGGKVIEYGPEEEGPHPAPEHEFWQESVVLVWWDKHNRVGGYHRIGHEPNTREGPIISLCNNIFTPEWALKRDDVLPLREEDRLANGFGTSDGSCRFEYTDHAIWTINDQGVTAELHAYDIHNPVDIYPKSGSLGEEIAPNHMEVASTVKGQLSIKGKHYDIDGLAFRDHGWGIRVWDVFLSHRWIAGVFDDEMSFLAMTFVGTDDKLVSLGCLFRDGKLTYTDNLEIITYMDSDGLTHKGGHVTMTLTTGEVLEIECTPIQKGVMTWVHGVTVVDTLCTTRMGDLQGFCDFELSNNPMNGKRRPVVGINAHVTNGLHKL